MVFIHEVVAKRSFSNASDEYCDVFIAEVLPAKASELLTSLSNEFPLQQFELAHLKRIRRSSIIENEATKKLLEVIVCPQSSISTVSASIMDALSNLKLQRVPRCAPLCASGVYEILHIH